VIQRALLDDGFNPGDVDGKTGANTYGAVNQALERRRADLPDDWRQWSDYRRAVAYLQLLCKDRGIEVGGIDGFWGPQTEFAFDALSALLENGELPRPWRDEVPLDANPNGWPRQDEDKIIQFYGQRGEHLVKLELPYPHRLAWDLRKNVAYFYCHAKVHDSARRVLQRVLDHYGMDRINELHLDRWSGCFAERRMRGGTRWSMHAWGIAIDYDDERNRFNWGRDRAAFAHPDYDAWWRFWEEEGWVSLGRARNFDWMHVQAAKL
jgi:hypothetical protein